MTTLEREVKLRFDSVEDARAALVTSDATPLRCRRLQEDYLPDDTAETLHLRRCVLRVRIEAGKSLVTFKGPVQVSTMKVREELETVVGADCMVMAVAHIAHDCVLGERVILANNVMLGGHVEIGDTVFVGGGTAIHQFVRIGRQAVIGGMSGVEADVIPFGSAMGNRARMIGLNLIGMKRRGFARAQIHALRSAFRTLFRDPGVFEERLAEVERRFAGDPNVAEMLAFIRAPSRRGLCKAGRPAPEEEAEEEAA